MQATQQQTYRNPRSALAALTLAVVFATGTLAGVAIGIAFPGLVSQPMTISGAASGSLVARDRSYEAVEDAGPASGSFTFARDRAYDAVEKAGTVNGTFTPAHDRAHEAIEDARAKTGSVTGSGSAVQRHIPHGPLEID